MSKIRFTGNQFEAKNEYREQVLTVEPHGIESEEYRRHVFVERSSPRTVESQRRTEQLPLVNGHKTPKL